MEVFVKSFNRPFYLERCLLTIERCGGQSCNITVLDDGTPMKYLWEIQSRFPRVRIVQSPHGELKTKRVAEGSFSESLNDAELAQLGLVNSQQFWCQEIAKCNETYICVMEEDCWFTRGCAFDDLVRHLNINGALLFRMFWNSIPAVSAQDRINHRAQAGGIEVQYYFPTLNNSFERTFWFCGAQAIIRRDYWLHACTAPNYNFTIGTQFSRAFDFVKQMTGKRMTFAQSAGQMIAHGYSTTARKTRFTGELFEPHIYNEALSEAWLAGRFNSAEALPNDFSDDYIASVLGSEMNEDQVANWREWKLRFLNYYRSMGAEI